MSTFVLLVLLRVFELRGQLTPPARGSVTLHGVASPFTADVLTGPRGEFRFRDLDAGAYTITVFAPGAGETRRTIEIGPAFANAEGQVHVTLELKASTAPRGATIHARELKIPDRARREYANAEKKLSKRDITSAIAHLERAVKIAPHFAAAWNHMGTIAYQTRQYSKAEEHFREALEHDPDAFEPLVNLGGVLLTLGNLDEALKYNLFSVLTRPEDALANSQLGMTYFAVGNLDLGRKYLEIAKKLDASHFSHPQLTLAEIHLRRNDRPAALAEFEEFLRLHPDNPSASQVRAIVGKLRP